MTDSIDADDAQPSESGLRLILGVVNRIDLERAPLEWSHGCREVFVLYDVEGFEHSEVGAMLAISASTSQPQLHQACMRLHGAWHDVRKLGRRDEHLHAPASQIERLPR